MYTDRSVIICRRGLPAKSVRRNFPTKVLFQTGMVLCVIACGCVSTPRRDPAMHEAWLEALPTELVQESSSASAYHDIARNQPEKHGAVLLETGDDALLARLHLIHSARETIDIQTFIWRDDPVTRSLFLQLEQAAKRGVHIRILVDALNPIGDPSLVVAMGSVHRNIEISFCRPLSHRMHPTRSEWLRTILFEARRANRRMHNKVFIVDNEIAIVGGRNYEDAYYDRDRDMIFKDRDVLVTGPATRQMLDMFETYWNHEDTIPICQFKDVRTLPDGRVVDLHDQPEGLASLKHLAERKNLADVRPHLAWMEVGKIDFYWDAPGKLAGHAPREVRDFGTTMHNALLSAEDEIIMQTPYLVYRKGSRKEMREIRKGRPNLKFRLSSNSLAAADHIHVYAISFKYRQMFYKTLGLDIWEFMPHPDDRVSLAPGIDDTANPRLVLHAKTWVLDGKTSMIGSHNFDPRSTHFNTECGVIITDSAFADRVRHELLRDMAPGNSWIVGKRKKEENMLNRLGRHIGDISRMIPFLDILPYRYTSNFSLRDGATPLPSSRHADFYEHYEDVGQFPGSPGGGAIFKARLVEIFGGWTRPFM